MLKLPTWRTRRISNRVFVPFLWSVTTPNLGNQQDFFQGSPLFCFNFMTLSQLPIWRTKQISVRAPYYFIPVSQQRHNYKVGVPARFISGPSILLFQFYGVASTLSLAARFLSGPSTLLILFHGVATTIGLDCQQDFYQNFLLYCSSFMVMSQIPTW